MTNQSKCVLLTGANSGIGLATCKMLSQSGYYVFAGAKDDNGIKLLSDQNIKNVEPVLLNLQNNEHFTKVLDTIESYCKSKGTFHALINNAAFAIGSPIELTDIEGIKQSFQVNVFGLIELTKTLLPISRKYQSRIVNISSTNAFISSPYLGIYSATKFALEGINDALRIELLKWGIKVITIYPDVVKTPIFDKAIPISFNRFELHDIEQQKLYKTEFDMFNKLVRELESKGVEPEVIAKCILKSLTAINPQKSYYPEKNAKIKLFLKNILSKNMLDKILIKELSNK